MFCRYEHEEISSLFKIKIYLITTSFKNHLILFWAIQSSLCVNYLFIYLVQFLIIALSFDKFPDFFLTDFKY